MSSTAHYVASVRRIPKLTREAELAMVRAGDRKSLVTSYLPYAVSVASKYSKNNNVPFDDLIQLANLGLIRASEKFDAEKGYRFYTYAGFWIKAFILNSLRDNVRMVKLASSEKARKAITAMRYKQANTVEDIMDASKFSRREAEDMWCVLSRPDLRIDHTASGDQYEFTDARSPEQALLESAADEARKEVVRDALRVLSPRHRDIIERRILAEKPTTLEAIGQTYGVSRERIRQDQTMALKKLRAHIGRKHVAYAQDEW